MENYERMNELSKKMDNGTATDDEVAEFFELEYQVKLEDQVMLENR